MAGMSKKAQAGKKRGKKTQDASKRVGYASVSNGGIKRLARRAGVKRISADSFGQIRECAERFLDKLVSHALLYTECAN